MRLIGMLATITVCCAASALIAADQEVASSIKQLESGTVAEKTKAARILGEIGPAAADAIPSLVKSLELENPGLRHEVVVALGRINSDPNRVVPALNRLLSNPVPLLRHSVIDALLRFGPDAQSSIPQLKTLLADKEPLISVSAARAIVEIESRKGPDVAQATDILIAGLKSDRHDVSSEAIHGLAVVGRSSVPAIEQLVGDTDSVACLNACDALAALGPMAAPCVNCLLAAAKSSKAKLKWHAIIAIGDIGPSAKAAVPTLLAALADSDPQISFSAERSLQKIGTAAVPSLVTALKDERLQKNAAKIIGEIGPEASEAVPPLAELLQTKDADTRREVILALAAIGPNAKSAAPELVKLLGDKQFSYRPSAAFALGRIGSKEAIPTLKESLKEPNNSMLHLASVWALLQLDPSNEEYVTIGVPQLTAALENEKPEYRREAAKALGKIGAQAKSAVSALQARLSDKSQEVRRESLIALAEIGAESAPAMKDLLNILDEGEASFRPIAAYALGRIGAAAKPAIPRLQRILASGDTHEKTVAAWALVNIAPDPQTIEEAIPLLSAAMTSAENPEVRIEIAGTLGKIGGQSAVAKDALKKALNDSNESVRKAAEKALNQLK